MSSIVQGLSKMEFPPEIVALISQYSKPYFKHFREYNCMLRLCGFDHWEDLKKALQTKPEKVLPRIYLHEKAQTVWLHAYHEKIDREEKIRQGYLWKQYVRERTYRELVNSLQN